MIRKIPIRSEPFRPGVIAQNEGRWISPEVFQRKPQGFRGLLDRHSVRLMKDILMQREGIVDRGIFGRRIRWAWAFLLTFYKCKRKM